MQNYKIGLKLWSTNACYVAEAKKLWNQGIYDYIELFAVLNSYEQHISLWKDLEIPFIIHAPHAYAGINLAHKAWREQNFKNIKESLRFANALNAAYVIVHPGLEGTIEETVYQLNHINDPRIVLENHPMRGLGGEQLVGGTYEELKYALEQTGVGFCLDIAHAVYSANARGADPLSEIEKLVTLSPQLFHLSDGDYDSLVDNHLNLGKGTFLLHDLLHIVLQKYGKRDMSISLETKKNFSDSLSDFVDDVTIFQTIMGEIKYGIQTKSREL